MEENKSFPSKYINYAALIMGAVYLVFAITKIPAIFSSLGLLTAWVFAGFIFRFVSRVFMFLGPAVFGASLLLFGLRRKQDEKSNTLFLTVGCAGVFYIALRVISGILVWAARLFRVFLVGNGVLSMLVEILLALVCVAALFVLMSMEGSQPLAGINADTIKAEAEKIPDTLKEEGEALKAQYMPDAAREEKPSDTKEAEGGKALLNENRKLWKYYVFGFITCGIYQYYVIYTLSRDLNTACEGDGEKTGGILKYIILTFVTCGIYTFIWHYKFMQRMQKNSEKYGIMPKTVGHMDLGPCWLILVLAGVVLSACGIGIIAVIYAEYLLFANMNMICHAYNGTLSDNACKESHDEDKEDHGEDKEDDPE